jgi:preprotein translocase subunit Sss1
VSLLVLTSRKGPQKPEYVDIVVVTAVGLRVGTAVGGVDG